MRITGGQFLNRRLELPKKHVIRPTKDQVRQALFNILPDVDDWRVLDLFCGTGSLGIEALSRGASKVIFVDSAPASLRALKANLQNIGILEDTTLQARSFQSDACAALERLTQQAQVFDLILVDPPYREGLSKKTLITLGRYAILAPGGILVCEHHISEEMPQVLEGEAVILQQTMSRQYGDTALTIYERQ